MGESRGFVVSSAPHPRPVVRRAGFPLDHPYVEQCWAHQLGPSTVLMLRRISELWERSDPAVIDLEVFAVGLGMTSAREGPAYAARRRLQRLPCFGMGQLDGSASMTIYRQVEPLGCPFLAEAPEWTRRAHDRLLDEHVRNLASGHGATPPDAATASASAPTPASLLQARLDRLDRASRPAPGLPR